MKKTDKPVKCTLKLKEVGDGYQSCTITAKTVYKKEAPVKIIIAVEAAR
jgi:hypothetical protein